MATIGGIEFDRFILLLLIAIVLAEIAIWSWKVLLLLMALAFIGLIAYLASNPSGDKQEQDVNDPNYVVSEVDSAARIVEVLADESLGIDAHAQACYAIHQKSINATDSGKAKEEIVAAGGVPAIMKTLIIHKDSLETVGWAMSALTVLEAVPGVKDIVLDTAKMFSVVDAMSVWSNSSVVARRGCTLLGALSFGHEDLQVAIVDSGGVEAIMVSMKKHRHNADVQQWACYALFNLTHDHPANKLYVARVGALAHVVSATDYHPDNAVVVRHAVMALANNMSSTQGTVATQLATIGRSAGALPAVRRAVERFPEGVEIQQLGNAMLSQMGAIVGGDGVEEVDVTSANKKNKDD